MWQLFERMIHTKQITPSIKFTANNIKVKDFDYWRHFDLNLAEQSWIMYFMTHFENIYIFP